MRRAALILLAAGMLVAGSALASSSSSLYNRGNELYQAGKFSEAAAAYRQALETGVRNPDLYYNLGNAELRQNRLGPGMAAYLRAERLAPGDPDIRFNLDYARGKVASKLPRPQPGPITRGFEFLVQRVSVNNSLLVLGGLWWLAAAGVIGLLLRRGEGTRRAARAALLAAVMIFALFLPVAGVRIRRDRLTERAVIVAAKESARSGPGETNSVLFELNEGMEVTVGQCESGWCKVSPGSGFVGWAPASAFERLNPDPRSEE